MSTLLPTAALRSQICCSQEEDSSTGKGEDSGQETLRANAGQASELCGRRQQHADHRRKDVIIVAACGDVAFEYMHMHMHMCMFW